MVSKLSFLNKEKWIDITVYSLIAVWTMMMISLKLTLFYKFSLFSDIVSYLNMFWNTNLSGDILYSDYTLQRFGSKTFFSEHFASSYLLLAPVYKLSRDPKVFLILQVFSASLSAVFLYFLGKIVIENTVLAASASLSFIFSSPLIISILDDVYGFHPDSFIFISTMLSIYFLEKKWFFWAIIFSIINMGWKTNVPYFYFIFSIGLLFKDRKSRIGLAFLLFSLLFIGGNFFLAKIFGIVNRNASNALNGIYQQILSGNILSYIMHPERIFLFWNHKPYNYINLFPVVFSPIHWIAIVPDIGLYTLLLGKHTWYVNLSLMALTIGSIYGWKSIYEKFKNHRKWIITFSLLMVILYVGKGFNNFYTEWKRISKLEYFADQSEIAEMRSQIPPDVRVSASANIMLHFTDRRHLAEILTFHESDYFLVNPKSKVFHLDSDVLLEKFVEEKLKSGHLSVVKEMKSGLVLYKKTKPF